MSGRSGTFAVRLGDQHHAQLGWLPAEVAEIVGRHPAIERALAGLGAAWAGEAAGRVVAVTLDGRDSAMTRALCRALGVLYGSDGRWRDVVAGIVGGLHGRDRMALVGRVHQWVRDNVQFLPEPDEQVQTPALTVARRFGDCDDHAALTGALLHALGIPWRLELLRDALGRPFHIWTVAEVGGRDVHVETCEPSAQLGEHPREIQARLKIAL